MSTAILYQPSNGSEGANFVETYCMNCIHCDPDPDGPKQCKILCASLCYSVDEPGYPKEWIYGDNGEPTCTKWEKWDWEKMGNPDKPKKENYVMPYNPNQLNLF